MEWTLYLKVLSSPCKRTFQSLCPKFQIATASGPFKGLSEYMSSYV